MFHDLSLSPGELTDFETHPLRPMRSVRFETSILARPERKVLHWLCRHMPSSISPDHLTAVGFVGALVVCASYLMGYNYRDLFWLATVGLVVNWFGDSLDGSLARYRGIERARYGYFVDHSVDAVSASLIMGGLGLSHYVHLDTALLALVGYLLMCIYVFLANHVTGKFRLSFSWLGPTELRLGLIAMNYFLYDIGRWTILFGHKMVSVYDIVLTLCAVLFIFLYAFGMLRTSLFLRREDVPPSS